MFFQYRPNEKWYSHSSIPRFINSSRRATPLMIIWTNKVDAEEMIQSSACRWESSCVLPKCDLEDTSLYPCGKYEIINSSFEWYSATTMTMTMTMTMTHSEKSIQHSSVAWPSRREQRGHDPTKKKSLLKLVWLALLTRIAHTHLLMDSVQWASGPPGLHTTARETPNVHIFRVPPSITPPKFHERTPKRGRKEWRQWREREKKSAKFWAPHPSRSPPFGASTLRGLHPLGHHLVDRTLCGPKIQHLKIGRSRYWPTSKLAEDEIGRGRSRNWPKSIALKHTMLLE